MAAFGLLQSALLSDLRIFGVSPDWVFVAAITWVIIRGQPDGLLAALVGGAVTAALSGGPRFQIVFLFCACSLLVYFAQQHLPRMAGIIPYLSIIAATLLYKGVLVFYMQTTNQRVYLPGMFVKVILPAVLLNLALIVITYHLGMWMNKRLGPPTVDWE